jgi:hypothetical protein
VYKNSEGYGRLTAYDCNYQKIMFVWTDILDIFAIRESRINNNDYEEA